MILFLRLGEGSIMQIEFFLPMIPPTVTQQEHKVMVRNGKPFFYEPAELKATRQKLLDAVGRYSPDKPMEGPVRLITKWIWLGSNVCDGEAEYKTTKPDTDNMIKMLKDCMTKAHFWHDDAQVASEITEKFLGMVPGIYVEAAEI